MAVVRADWCQPEWMTDWMNLFARPIDRPRSTSCRPPSTASTGTRNSYPATTLSRPFRNLKQQPGRGLLVGGVTLPLALAEQGLIDEYQFVVQPRLAGHGPTLFAGLSEACRLEARGPEGVRLRGRCAAVRAPVRTLTPGLSSEVPRQPARSRVYLVTPGRLRGR